MYCQDKIGRPTLQPKKVTKLFKYPSITRRRRVYQVVKLTQFAIRHAVEFNVKVVLKSTPLFRYNSRFLNFDSDFY